MPNLTATYGRPALPQRLLLRGRDEPPPEGRALRAGPVSLFVREGELVDLRLGDVPLLSRIGVLVHDRAWAVVPGVRSELHLEAGDDRFVLTYRSHHCQDEVDFLWTATVRGEPYGAITFVMDGQARTTFWRQRLGFVLLHPAAICAGRAFVSGRQDGVNVVGRFPETICGEATIPGLREMRALDYEVGGGLRFECRFEGELFETDDGRNWLSPAFRTFCTPLSLPAPVCVDAGTRIVQSVTLRARGASASPALAVAVTPVTVTVDTTRRVPLPPIGIQMADHGLALSQRERERLRVVRPAHLRVDLALADDGWRQRLADAAQDARLLGAGLEVALSLGEHDVGLAPLLGLVRETHAAVHRWLVCATDEARTSARTAQRAASLRVLGAPVGGGTQLGLFELNHERPAVDDLELVGLPIRPPPSSDDETLLESLAALPQALACARSIAKGRPLVVSPLALRARRSGPTPVTPPDVLPPEVDPRQLSLLGAAWTLGCLSTLIHSGVASLTCFETTGWHGLLETDEGSPRPGLFRSIPGAVFPLYHVLADVAEHAGGTALGTESSAPHEVAALALTGTRGTSVLLANLRPEPRRVALYGLARHYTLRLLEAANAQQAMVDPGAFRCAQEPLLVTEGPLTLELPPFALARIRPREVRDEA